MISHVTSHVSSHVIPHTRTKIRRMGVTKYTDVMPNDSEGQLKVTAKRLEGSDSHREMPPVQCRVLSVNCGEVHSLPAGIVIFAYMQCSNSFFSYNLHHIRHSSANLEILCTKDYKML